MSDPDDAIEEKYREIMRDLARFLDVTLNGPDITGPSKVGFCLLVFDLGSEGPWRTSYIANARREDMIKQLGDLIERLKRNPPNLLKMQ